jgi:hypothetical protein
VPVAALVYKVKAHPVTDFLLPQYQQVLLQAAAATAAVVAPEVCMVKILGQVAAKVPTTSKAVHMVVEEEAQEHHGLHHQEMAALAV